MPHQPSNSDAVTDTFVVGGAGNRFLPADTRAIERSIDSALLAIATDAGIERERLLLLVSVAEGADRLLIKAASRLGIRYECVLPCSPLCFSEDFSSLESVEEFEALLAGADAVTSPEPEPAEKLQGYLWASRYILGRADLLLAVWDGSPGNGPAGTADTIDLATGRELPVIWIPTDPPIEPVRLDLLPC
jgi:hypothetical protein